MGSSLLHALLLIGLTALGAFAGSVVARLRSLRVQDLKRLRVEPGDKIILRLAEDLDTATIERLHEELQGIFPDNRLIVLPGGHEFSVVGSAPVNPSKPTS